MRKPPDQIHQDKAAKVSSHNEGISPILASLQEIHAKYQKDFSGKVAAYIPELAKADPNLFGIALVTADGQIYQAGDAHHLFTIQSISKPFVHGMALEDHGLDYVLGKVGVDLDSFSFLILDLKRVLQIDECAETLLMRTKDLLKTRNKMLLLAHLPEHCGDPFRTKETDGQIESLFADTDSALEWCEDQLLHKQQPVLQHDSRQVVLSEMEILAGFSSEQVALIESIVKEKRYCPGEIIIREGEVADSLYFVAAGRVSIYLNIKSGARRQRLSTITPGVAFGELALLDGGTRSADVIADEPTVCYMMPAADFQLLAKSHPEVQNRLVLNIGRELSARLRRADAEIRSLAD